MRILITILAVATMSTLPPAMAQEASEAVEPVSPAVEQLRHVIGAWHVETDFIGPDGKIRGSVPGRYEFVWVVPDRIVSGWSEQPSIQQKSAILFFYRTESKEIEMVSVGPDGRLWRMIGDEDSETRVTPNETMSDGSTIKLRFTRHDVTADRFASTMELSHDGGESWRIGNRQRFTRISQSPEN